METERHPGYRHDWATLRAQRDVNTVVDRCRAAGDCCERLSLGLLEWMRKNTPRCIIALGPVMPCTADDVLAAYRRRVKTLHPDRGGDRRELLRLQAHFEEALAFVENK